MVRSIHVVALALRVCAHVLECQLFREFSVLHAIAIARAVVGHRECAVQVACWQSTIYGCSYELSIGFTSSLKTVDGDCWRGEGASASTRA